MLKPRRRLRLSATYPLFGISVEAAAVGGLTVAAGIVEFEDDFARETDRGFAHVLCLEAFRSLLLDLGYRRARKCVKNVIELRIVQNRLTVNRS